MQPSKEDILESGIKMMLKAECMKCSIQKFKFCVWEQYLRVCTQAHE